MQEKFSTVRKGYDPSEVEAYIDNLETVVKSYKEKDTAIKNAIINAQVAADNIVNEAEYKTRKIVQDSVEKFNKIISSISGQRMMIQQFQDDYNALINKYLHQINELDINDIYAKLDELETLMRDINNKTSML